MDYKKIYNDLIFRGKHRLLDSYKETHHIIPKCIGGTDETENLVELTPEEHYLAHQLLVKIYNNNHALVKAAMMMRCNRPTNKVYGWLRRRHSIAMSLSQSGIGNSQSGTRWIHNKELRENKKISLSVDLPDGWEIGRIIDFVAFFEKQKVKQQKIDSKNIKEETITNIAKKIKIKHDKIRKSEEYRMAKSIKLYKEFRVSNLSLRKFAKEKNMVPMTLSKWFNKFIPDYDIVARTSANKQI